MLLERYLQGVCERKAGFAMAKANGKQAARDAGKAPVDVGRGKVPVGAEPAACESKGSRAQSCCCHHKATPRSEEFQRDLQKRLNRAIGQLNGVKAMIDDNRYCGDVLTQLAAAESAVHSISAILLQNHLETCVVEQIEAGNTAIVDEAMQLIKKFAR